MSARKGSLLEKQVDTVFSSAGFESETNVRLSGYEVDVHAEMGDLEVIVECKQYESSNLNVKNRIHEWKGKNESIGADCVVLAVYGQEIKDGEREIAEDAGMEIWGQERIEDLLQKNEEDRKEFLFTRLDVEQKELGVSYRRKIRKLVWKPYLEGDRVDADVAHEKLLLMVKRRIRRELNQQSVTRGERRRHINVFENIKKDGLIRSNIDVKSSSEKFDRIKKKLDAGETELAEGRQEKYLRYLESVESGFKDAKSRYLDSEGEKQVRRLVKSRMAHLLKYGADVEFCPRRRDKPINASRSNGKISLDFEIDNPGDLETIRWILTREGSYRQEEKENGLKRDVVSFSYDGVESATEAVLRIMNEYYGFDLQQRRIVDKKKDSLQRGEGIFSKLLSR
ncbi:hypothetical protein [Candidatus Nanohalococcus occultus]|uniref:Restriction endonuclease type IV Mrr domain-containing protein n=1 Tax=Candidatus Nanohalococcus occultus TaxID=2978047 RepID=A0ABY8CHI1_9ARCH|nr:hypothetical protein SVXNc_0981 [Candidatus Nanohaloarchaeota archaeon SVXNc]